MTQCCPPPGLKPDVPSGILRSPATRCVAPVGLETMAEMREFLVEFCPNLDPLPVDRRSRSRRHPPSSVTPPARGSRSGLHSAVAR